MPSPVVGWFARQAARQAAAAAAGRVAGGPAVSRRGFLAAITVGGLAVAGGGYELIATQTNLLQLALGQNTNLAGGTCGAAGDDAPSALALADIPADYLTLYQATPAEACPGLSWTVLAGIGKVETNHGRLQAPGVTSSANFAGAAGPMQMGIGVGPAGNAWLTYGDGVLAHVYDPRYAIPAAARKLAADGAPTDLHGAIFAYNHADWYVDLVLKQAAAYGGGQVPAGCTAAPLPTDVAGTVIRFALGHIGWPYVFGAAGPDAYDCSGFTMAAYRAAGITIPRTAAAQWAALPHVDPAKVAMADLIYFDVGPERPGVDHCGIVYDPAARQMIVARHTGTNIQIQSYAGFPTVGFARPAAR
jgi:peptidoglycan DL-endopeptidase CwlO